MGMTGMNPEQVKTQINEFDQGMAQIENNLQKAGDSYFETLKSNWYSPKAKEFSQKYSGELHTNTVDAVGNNSDIVKAQVSNAYNTMARAQGVATISDVPVYARKSGSNFGQLNESGPNGTVGINAPVVKQATEDYLNNLNTQVGNLENMSQQLSIYDSDGSIQQGYQQRINQMKSTIADSITNVQKDISDAIQTEQYNTNKAMEQSIEVLGGNAIEDATSYLKPTSGGSGSSGGGSSSSGGGTTAKTDGQFEEYTSTMTDSKNGEIQETAASDLTDYLNNNQDLFKSDMINTNPVGGSGGAGELYDEYTSTMTDTRNGEIQDSAASNLSDYLNNNQDLFKTDKVNTNPKGEIQETAARNLSDYLNNNQDLFKTDKTNTNPKGEIQETAARDTLNSLLKSNRNLGKNQEDTYEQLLNVNHYSPNSDFKERTY